MDKTNAAPKFTPGPWTLDDSEHGSSFKLTDADGEFVTYVTASRYVDERDDPIAEANARLIAAAPELYEALRQSYDDLQRYAPNSAGSIAARAALAKVSQS